VNHPGYKLKKPYSGEGFSIWWQPADDLSEVINGMLADSELSAISIPRASALAGFSLGGYTMRITSSCTESGHKNVPVICNDGKGVGACDTPANCQTQRKA